MKRQFVVLIGVIAVLFMCNTSLQAGQPKEKEQTVKGEIVDLHCYIDKGERGSGHKECGVSCAKGGGPIGIVDEHGNVYLVIAGEGKDASRDALIDKMSETVTVTGKVAKKGGLQALYVASVK